ncbi:MAG: SsrA-binding protein SmpB [Candidatus Omnitrophota bacterium]
MTVIATNKKAKRDFHILEAIEAGIELRGTEVKSLRQKRANLQDSFARVEGNQIYLYNMHISPYEQGNRFNVDSIRVRKLLLHKKEIQRITGKIAERGLTLVPLRVYFKRGFAKIELAIAKGKRLYDKREQLRRKTTEREIERAIKARNK